MTNPISKEQIEFAYSRATNAKQAAGILGVSGSTFKRYAMTYGLYKTNQGGRGDRRLTPRPDRTPTHKMLRAGSHFKSTAIKQRLLLEGLKENECEECRSKPFWQGKPLVLHLDHIDGDSTNNLIENLRMLCPNCHSQTSTYCRGQGKNKAGVAK